jgi:Flp pilus assembly protein TadD
LIRLIFQVVTPAFAALGDRQTIGFLTAAQEGVMKSRACVVILLLAGSASAQLDAGTTIHRLRVRVAFAKGGCDSSTNVRLMGRSGPVADMLTNDRCEADFVNVPVGTYHLIVSGQNFADTDTGSIMMDSTGSPEVEVKVRRTNESEQTQGASAGPLVSAADLAIPVKAQKEFNKANGLMAKRDLNGAVHDLNKAIEIYPAYAAAYNNLGALYAQLGDRTKEREALEKAVNINDHFAPAYVNLGKMNIASGNFAEAEFALNKASSLDPTDTMTLVLLTYVEFMERHFDPAIAIGRKAHTLSGPHAYAHQITARAFEQKREGVNAMAELNLFLKEEATGPRADAARKELAELQVIVRKSGQTISQ